MTISQRIAQLEVELAEVSTTIDLATARVRGIKAELERLRSGIAPPSDLATERLTDAIEAVLRSSNGPLSPTQIKDQLAAAGRDEPLNKITSTLAYLKSRGRITLEARGEYRST